MSAAPHSVVVVGSGLAGYTLAREYRRAGGEGSMLIVTREAGHFYSKPMLSNALARGQTPESLPNADADRMAKDLDAEIRTRVAVTGIDTQAHTLLLGGERVRYERLVLALGADQRLLELDGDGARAVLRVNDLDDYARFRRAIDGARSAVVLGAGLIGCEFANDLAGAGYRVEVVEPLAHALGRLAPEPAARALQRGLEAAGVRFHFERTCRRIESVAEGLRAALSDGSNVVGDVVLSATGLLPRTALATAAGLDVGQGIRVDRSLATSARDVYALGDCAEVEGRVLPFVMPIMHAARALAATLCGRPTTLHYPAMPVVVKTPAHPAALAPPPPGAAGSWRIEGDEAGVEALFTDSAGAVLGLALTGNRVARRAVLARSLPAALP